MNKPLRHLSLVAIVMFALLFGSTSYVQYFAAKSLNENALNSRTFLAEMGRERGPIMVGDKVVIADSVESGGTYAYQRQYGGDGINTSMYAPVTGYFSVKYGATGLESSESSMLSGTDDALFYRNLGSLISGEEPPGAAVQTTIDPAVQQAAWDAIGDQRGAAVAIEPKTGKILAMVSKPSFDPNDLASHDSATVTAAYDSLNGDDTKPLINRAIGGNLYPPGSTYKLVVAAAALESGNYSADSQLNAPDALSLPQTTSQIRNAGGGSCGGTATLQYSLEISCNTSFADLGMTLGADAIREQSEKFGFQQDVRIPMRVEQSTFPADPNPPQLAQSSIGQFEVRTTPMQVAMIASGIANDGVVMQPTLIDSVFDPTSLHEFQGSPTKELSRAMSADNANELTDMMKTVVSSGTGRAAQISGVEVAAKTGTAQHAQGASPHAWFTAFAPADDPEIAIAVVVENGGNAGSEASGGRTAGPVAKAMIEARVNS